MNKRLERAIVRFLKTGAAAMLASVAIFLKANPDGWQMPETYVAGMLVAAGTGLISAMEKWATWLSEEEYQATLGNGK